MRLNKGHLILIGNGGSGILYIYNNNYKGKRILT
jgi:hypothetical protein